MKLGAVIPTSGPLPSELGIPEMARRLETAGFESLWVPDHVVLPERIESPYPFAADGKVTWDTTAPYVDAIVALSLIAAATERATLGTAVLVLPLRHPIVLAKQAASIDAASGGRLRLGVGAGWLREEFEALNVPFDDRGARLGEWLELLRACWTGSPPAHASERYTLPGGLICLPKPARDIPVLVGGHSRAALRRAGRLGSGWLAQQPLSDLRPDELRAGLELVRAAAAEADRDAAAVELVLRIVESDGRPDEVAAALPALAAAGVTEIVVNVDWSRDPAEQAARMAS